MPNKGMAPTRQGAHQMDQQHAQALTPSSVKDSKFFPSTWRFESFSAEPQIQQGFYSPSAGLRVRQHHAPPPYLQQQQQQQQQQQYGAVPQQLPPPQQQDNHPYYYYPYQQQQLPPTPVEQTAPPPAPAALSAPPLQHSTRPIRKRRRPPHSYASLIAQAILTSPDHRLTLREIYDWIQSRYPNLYEANETGWQNTIRHNLSLNRCFMKLPRVQDVSAKNKGSKGGYWAVDVDKLSHTNFGRQIIESGFLNNLEYWQQQQAIEEQRQRQHHHAQMTPSASSTSSTTSSSNMKIAGELPTIGPGNSRGWGQLRHKKIRASDQSFEQQDPLHMGLKDQNTGTKI
ncbi:hypothetical protein BCR43DRAFT_563863 [Syncephalastrum racemosum]|uniref:Fork-head domain-containing protein n=1 Tax=Syncephalastrum racemosum TaxID=13706 RepID=A0A1X2HE52_SYNRA|nr:hypothetical protein BCR43DRAFT_563863 [Syncephalastrum racemosum]